MPRRDSQDGQVVVVNSDKTQSTGEENGKPIQYSGLENPMNSMNLGKFWKLVMDREAWCATVHWVAKCWTQLSD